MTVEQSTASGVAGVVVMLSNVFIVGTSFRGEWMQCAGCRRARSSEFPNRASP